MANYYRDVLAPMIFHADADGTRRLVRWLRHKHLIARNVQCTRCHGQTRLQRHRRSKDAYRWYCGRCRKQFSLRRGSWFSGKRLSLQRCVNFLWKWSNNGSLANMENEGIGSKSTLVKLARSCREVCWQALTLHPIPRLGGPGVIVQIDESKFNHKSKYQRGRRPETEKWVLGLFDTQYTPTRPFLQLVPRRDALTLLPLIGRKVAPGSVLHTDGWAAYNHARRVLRLQHFTVNRSENFVDPITGRHTQNAESGWNVAKEKFKRMRGNTNPRFLQEYLQEFMWRRWYGNPMPNIYLDDF